jgi:predicted component of type VI protein secretion system
MRTARLPKRFPVGTKYVIEGKSRGAGKVHVVTRYVVFPDGRCFDLPADHAEQFQPHPAWIGHASRHGMPSDKKH